MAAAPGAYKISGKVEGRAAQRVRYVRRRDVSVMLHGQERPLGGRRYSKMKATNANGAFVLRNVPNTPAWQMLQPRLRVCAALPRAHATGRRQYAAVLPDRCSTMCWHQHHPILLKGAWALSVLAGGVVGNSGMPGGRIEGSCRPGTAGTQSNRQWVRRACAGRHARAEVRRGQACSSRCSAQARAKGRARGVVPGTVVFTESPPEYFLPQMFTPCQCANGAYNRRKGRHSMSASQRYQPGVMREARVRATGVGVLAGPRQNSP